MNITRMPFDEVFADESGGNIKTPQSEYLREGRFPVIDQGKTFIAGYVDDETRVCGNGNAAIIFGDHTRCVKFIDTPFCMGADGVKVLRPKIEADLKYLYYYLRQLNLPDAGYDRHFKYLKRTEVVLLPLPEQRRIAAILDQADALRAKRREALAQLDRLTQAIFVEMFGEPVANPKGFESCLLGDIIEFVGGSQPSKEHFTFEPSPDSIRLVQIRDFRTDEFKTYIPRKLAKRFFEVDDVMIGRYGPPVFQIFRGLSGSYNVALMKALPKSGVLRDFIFFLLQEPGLHGYVVERSTRTAGQSGVNLELLESYPAFKPSLALQEAFANRIQAIEALKAQHRAAQADLDALFTSLQHRAFRGEL